MSARRPRYAAFMKHARLVAVTLAAASSPVWGDDGVAERTDSVAEEVAKLRGLKIKKTIKRDVMTEDAMRARLVERFAERASADERAGQQLALERWGLVAADVDVHALMVDVLTEQIAGFYDAADQTLYIAERGDEAASDMLLAHEILHALQDQHFKLAKLTDLPRADADARLARQALIEGDGMVTAAELVLARQKIAPPWGMEDALTMMTKTIEARGPQAAGALAGAPLVVRDLLLFPYAAGLRFVAALRARHPWKKVDKVYRDPPASTEQVLHPELYLAGEDAPHRVTAGKQPPASLSGWRTVHETVWGEAGWSVLLRQHGVDAERAGHAAAGWGGDRTVVYARPGDAAIADLGAGDAVGIALTSWDEEVDAIELEEAAIGAFEQWVVGTIVEETPGRTVWLGGDLRVSIVERRDDRVLVIAGAPLSAMATIADEVWKGWKVKR
jgi:hypothetical protein